LLAEWHIPPEYIIENWTQEKFELMVEKLSERKKREIAAQTGRVNRVVSDEQLFRMTGIKVQKVKHGN